MRKTNLNGRLKRNLGTLITTLAVAGTLCMTGCAGNNARKKVTVVEMTYWQREYGREEGYDFLMQEERRLFNDTYWDYNPSANVAYIQENIGEGDEVSIPEKRKFAQPDVWNMPIKVGGDHDGIEQEHDQENRTTNQNYSKNQNSRP